MKTKESSYNLNRKQFSPIFIGRSLSIKSRNGSRNTEKKLKRTSRRFAGRLHLLRTILYFLLPSHITCEFPVLRRSLASNQVPVLPCGYLRRRRAGLRDASRRAPLQSYLPT